MSADFSPTHRTNRAIGTIQAGSPIRVAQYDDLEYFSPVLSQLGIDPDLCRWSYFGQTVRVRYNDSPETMVCPDDYIISDGENIEASDTDSGWELLPTRKVSGTEDVAITFHETYYCLHGKESGTTLRMTPKDILSLADRIKDLVPEPCPLDEARYIYARFVLADEYRTLAKIHGTWYDNNGEAYTQEQVLDCYDEIEVIV